MTKAELLRKLQVGQGLIMTHNSFGGGNNSLIGKTRYIVKKQTNGVYLNEDKTATKGSFLELNAKASLFEANDQGFKIYEAGNRPLTDSEQRILANVPSKRPENQKQLEIDMLTDGSSMYWRDKAYYKENNAEYLHGTEYSRGMKYNYNTNTVTDENVRGEVSLAYEFTS